MRQNRLATNSTFEWPGEHALEDDRTRASETPLIAGNGAGLRAIEGSDAGREQWVDRARSLLDRGDLLQLLDHALAKRVTVISAPPGSGKTSLLRAWADRSTNPRRIVFVPVARNQQSAQQFWGVVLATIDPDTDAAALDGDHLVDRVLSEVTEPVVLIVD